mgnify:CR=1 FL=1
MDSGFRGENRLVILKYSDGYSEYRRSLAFRPSIVIVMLGTNDAKPRYWKGTSAFRDAMLRLLTDYQNLPSVPTVACILPPQTYRNRYHIREDIMQTIRDILKSLPFPFVEIPPGYVTIGNGRD